MQLYYWFTGVGACLAIFNTLFLIFDRLFRYRPVASITAVRGMGGGSHATPVLRIKNTAPFDIVVERFSVDPPYYAVSANSEIRAMVDIMIGADVPILLSPNEERQLVLIPRVQESAPTDRSVVFRIEWRRGYSIWFRQCPVWVRSSLDDIDLRISAAMNSHRGN